MLGLAQDVDGAVVDGTGHIGWWFEGEEGRISKLGGERRSDRIVGTVVWFC